jgi:hypothetical protein
MERKEDVVMKPFLAVVVLFTAITAYAQTATPGNDAMESQIRRGLATRPEQSYFALQLEKANEIKRNGVTYNGILVELAKTDNPLQLINPAAPPEYGSSEDNVVRDANGEQRGLNLFSIHF